MWTFQQKAVIISFKDICKAIMTYTSEPENVVICFFFYINLILFDFLLYARIPQLCPSGSAEFPIVWIVYISGIIAQVKLRKDNV